MVNKFLYLMLLGSIAAFFFAPKIDSASVSQKSRDYRQTDENQGLGSVQDSIIFRPDYDTSQYSTIVLPNSFRAVVISKSQMRTARVVLEVGVGYYADPPSLPGASKLLGMLLFGSSLKKDTIDFFSFINSHGGDCSLKVTETKTLFSFEIELGYISAALEFFSKLLHVFPVHHSPLEQIMGYFSDEFIYAEPEEEIPSQFFYSSLLSDSWLSQNQITISRDNMKIDSLFTETNKPILRNFFKTHYVPSNMCMAFKSGGSISFHSNILHLFFDSLPASTGRDLSHFTQVNPWDELSNTQLQNRIQVSSDGSKLLLLRWKIKEQPSWTKLKLTNFLNYIFTHGGRNSLETELQAKNLIEKMEMYFDKHFFNLLTAEFKLKTASEEEVLEVLKIFFQAVATLKSIDIDESIFNQWKSTKLGLFRIAEDVEDLLTLEELLDSLKNQNTYELLREPSVPSEWNKQAFSSLLSSINTNFLLYLSGPTTSSFRSTTTVFDKPCRIEPLPAGLLDQLRTITSLPNAKDLLPGLNPFILTDKDIVVQPRLPVAVPVMEKSLKFWYQYHVPTGAPIKYLKVHFSNPIAFKSAKNMALLCLMRETYVLALEKETHYAFHSGNGFWPTIEQDGISFEFTGFQSHIQSLLDSIIVAFSILRRTREIKFERILNATRETIDGQLSAAIYASEGIKKLLHPHTFSNQALLLALKECTYDDLFQFYSDFVNSRTIETLYVGDMTFDAYSRWMILSFPTNYLLEKQYPVPNLLTPGFRIFGAIHPSLSVSSVKTYFQICTKCNAKTLALLHLFHALGLRDGFLMFYITPNQKPFVLAEVDMSSRFVGYSIQVFKPTLTSIQLENLIEGGLRHAGESIRSMRTEEFEYMIHDVFLSLSQTPTHIYFHGNKIWQEVKQMNLKLPSFYDIRKQLKLISKDDLLHFFETYFMSSHNRRRISVHVSPTPISQNDLPHGTKLIPNFSVSS